MIYPILKIRAPAFFNEVICGDRLGYRSERSKMNCTCWFTDSTFPYAIWLSRKAM
jgi:hypothetical protein